MNDGRAWGVLFARTVLGLMFFQGALWRIFGIGPVGHARRFFVDPYQGSFLPEWSLWVAGTSVPFLEITGGALLLVGLWRVRALVLIGAVLVIVTFGHLVAEPIYSIAGHIYPRLTLAVFLLVAPPAWDRYSLDEWLASRRAAAGPGA